MIENINFPILQSFKTIKKHSYLDIYTKYNILTSKSNQLDFYKHFLKFGQMSQEIDSRIKLVLLEKNESMFKYEHNWLIIC